MLLDTPFLVDLLRGDEEAVERAAELEADLVQQRVSAMTLFELFYGVARSDQPAEEREEIEAVLASKPVVEADAAVMQRAGRLAGELAAEGVPVDDGDAVIAASALALDEPVLTRNVEHFERFEGLGVESY